MVQLLLQGLQGLFREAVLALWAADHADLKLRRALIRAIQAGRLPVFRVNLYSLVNLYSKFKFNDSRMLLSADAYEYKQQAKPR